MYFLVPEDIASRLDTSPDLLRSIVYVVDDSPRPESVRSFDMDRLEDDLLVVMGALGWTEVCSLLQTRLRRLPDPDGNLMIQEVAAANLERLRSALKVTSLDGARESLSGETLVDQDDNEMEAGWVEALVGTIERLRPWLLDRPQKGDRLLMVSDG